MSCRAICLPPRRGDGRRREEESKERRAKIGAMGVSRWRDIAKGSVSIEFDPKGFRYAYQPNSVCLTTSRPSSPPGHEAPTIQISEVNPGRWSGKGPTALPVKGCGDGFDLTGSVSTGVIIISNCQHPGYPRICQDSITNGWKKMNTRREMIIVVVWLIGRWKISCLKLRDFISINIQTNKNKFYERRMKVAQVVMSLLVDRWKRKEWKFDAKGICKWRWFLWKVWLRKLDVIRLWNLFLVYFLRKFIHR